MNNWCFNEKQKLKKNLNNFVDSSEDETIVSNSAYPRLPQVEPKIVSPLIIKRLEALQSEHSILKQAPISHQNLLKNPAMAVAHKKSKFPAPLNAVSKINALPSKPKIQHKLKNTIVPAFRGITVNRNLTPTELFCFTRADWISTHHFASITFKIAKIDIATYTNAFLANDDAFLENYSHYNLKTIQEVPESFDDYEVQLKLAAQKLKAFFKCADKITKSFINWKKIIPNLRNIKDVNTANKSFSLAQILAYVYVNNYDNFKTLISQFKPILKKLNNKPLAAAFNALEMPTTMLDGGMYHLSEGQIPRHALLYSFGVKVYSKGQTITPQPLYAQNCKPYNHNVYLGKIMITANPNTLFSGYDKASFIPDFDAKFGNKIIAKTVVPEKEIQHPGANLQGKVATSVNIKLPKFHHEIMPKRYLDKYGINLDFYKKFQETFTFLLAKQEFGKLSWMYLETIILAHLIHFHEDQLFRSCSLMALDTKKDIYWVDRTSKKIPDPYALVYISSEEDVTMSSLDV